MEDDVLPLTKPIVGISGKVYTELPIPKGTHVALSVHGYNLYVSFTPPRYRAHIVVFTAGTRICGVRMLTRSDRNVGSKRTRKLNRPLGCMGTCTVMHGVPMESLCIDLSFAQFHILRGC